MKRITRAGRHLACGSAAAASLPGQRRPGPSCRRRPGPSGPSHDPPRDAASERDAMSARARGDARCKREETREDEMRRARARSESKAERAREPVVHPHTPKPYPRPGRSQNPNEERPNGRLTVHIKARKHRRSPKGAAGRASADMHARPEPGHGRSAGTECPSQRRPRPP